MTGHYSRVPVVATGERSLTLASVIRIVGLVLVLVSGCGAADVNQAGLLVTHEIRRIDSQLISTVVFTRANMLDDAAITIVLREGAARREALSVVCGIVSPLITAADAAEAIGVEACAFDGVTLIANGPADCPDWPSN
jgi:hypothetical protein